MFNPIKTQLTILQQEGYSTGRFLKWWITHPFTYFISNKKPLILTQKVKRLLARLRSKIFSLPFSLVAKKPSRLRKVTIRFLASLKLSILNYSKKLGFLFAKWELMSVVK